MLSLDDLIELKRIELVERRKEEIEQIKERSPALHKEIAETEQILKEITIKQRKLCVAVRQELSHRFLVLKNKLKTLRAELDNLKSRLAEDKVITEFLLDIVPIMQLHETSPSLTTIADFKMKYLPHLLEASKGKKAKRVKFEVDATNSNLFCSYCNEQTTFILDEDLEICTNCAGVRKDRISTDPTVVHYDEAPVQRVLPYQRVVYFREFLKQLQGKSKVKLPQFIGHLITKEAILTLKKRIGQITEADVRKILLKKGLSKFSEHAPAILAKVNHKYKPVEIPKHVEHELVRRFAEVDKIFNVMTQAKGIGFFGGRKSMLSYHYLCAKFCEELGYTQLAGVWKISKSKRVCAKLNETYNKIKSFI